MILNVNQISVELGCSLILDNLSFSMKNGILAILGLNGSGKTTLLRSIAGLVKPNRGQIQIENSNISTFTKNELSKKISFVPQEYSSTFDYTVEEMLLLGRTPHIKIFDVPKTNDYSIINSIMHEMNIVHLRNRAFNQLSGGEKRLVLISMTLAQNTNILLLDEPTSYLDMKNSLLIIKKIQELSHLYNKLVILSMHDVNEAMWKKRLISTHQKR